MYRNITILIISFILVSFTGPKHYKSESWYKVYNDSINPGNELIYKAFYSIEGIKEKEISFNLSNTLYQKKAFFDSVGNKIHEIIFYDSSQLYGHEFLHKYDDDNNVIEQVTYGFKNGERIDSSRLNITYITNSQDKIVQARGINDLDTLVVITEYIYYHDGLLKNLITKNLYDTLVIQTYEYNKFENITFHSQILSDQKRTDLTYYNYIDSLLVERIQVFNQDTIRIEKYKYQEGLKKQIEVSELKEFEIERYKINIEYN